MYRFPPLEDAIYEHPAVLEVIVIGTLKNTLGPHHNGSSLGSAWPGMFQRGPESGLPPGQAYDTVSYGLFEPFALRQSTPMEKP